MRPWIKFVFIQSVFCACSNYIENRMQFRTTQNSKRKTGILYILFNVLLLIVGHSEIVHAHKQRNSIIFFIVVTILQRRVDDLWFKKIKKKKLIFSTKGKTFVVFDEPISQNVTVRRYGCDTCILNLPNVAFRHICSVRPFSIYPNVITHD